MKAAIFDPAAAARDASPAAGGTKRRPHPDWEGIPPPPRAIEIDLPAFTHGSQEKPFDLLIVGAGPAGLGAADAAAKRGLTVGVIDPNPTAAWRNNYGVWVDEFEEMGYADCFTRSWDKARVILDDKAPEGMELDRAYAQVDRRKLKAKLLTSAAEHGCQFQTGKVSSVAHSDKLSSAVMRDGTQLHARALLDATGHARRLVEFDTDFTPGYQAAYGILVEVESHPFALDEMLFMDWRDAHLDPAAKERNRSLPTFIYVMPFTKTRIFAEETSLVARPGVDFDDIKLRMKQRLEHLGVRVVKVLEEEHCFIPMGGVLPRQAQRTLGIGGTAGMVHPSTGFMLSRTLRSAATLADAVADGVEKQKAAEAAGDAAGGASGAELSKRVWEKIWPEEDTRMRTFMCFGMETLMQLDISGTRRFFKTFFNLPREMWSGFLSWKVRPFGLIGMGLSLFQGFESGMRFQFILSALPFIPSFVANFFPPQAGNRFTSLPWGGLALPIFRRAEPEAKANFELAKWLQGNIQILPPQPTSGPILSSSIDFAEMLGVEPALAGGKDDVDEPLPVTDFAALLGKDLNTPVPASQSRTDKDWVNFQQRKRLPDQGTNASVLPPLLAGATVDVVVVGGGPAGLCIAAALGNRGLSVGLISPESQFVNTYGVWTDEFEELGLTHTLSNMYADGRYWVDEASPNEGVSIGRRYGRVDRAKFRQELLDRAKAAGVRYMDALAQSVDNSNSEQSVVLTDSGVTVTGRITVLASGHNKELLEYEAGKPPGWQTAYGIELHLPDHPFPMDKAVFMDLRQSDPEVADGDGLWRVPSFLYVLPTDKDTVFLEETCLMSRVQMPFDELKRRLYRRMDRMGLPLSLEAVLEEEASWIPLGGGLPTMPQRNVAFGAAAALVHPGTGFSIYNSMRRANEVADAIANGLATSTPEAAAAAAYAVMWSPERRRVMGFYQFGMELVLSLNVAQLRNFFSTFYRLPYSLAHGFLSHKLSSSELLLFAFTFFLSGNVELKFLLLSHLVSPAGSGARLAEAYISGKLSAPHSHSVQRNAPPQRSALDVASDEQIVSEKTGVPTGFQQQRWWVVGRD